MHCTLSECILQNSASEVPAGSLCLPPALALRAALLLLPVVRISYPELLRDPPPLLAGFELVVERPGSGGSGPVVRDGYNLIDEAAPPAEAHTLQFTASCWCATYPRCCGANPRATRYMIGWTRPWWTPPVRNYAGAPLSHSVTSRTQT